MWWTIIGPEFAPARRGPQPRRTPNWNLTGGEVTLDEQAIRTNLPPASKISTGRGSYPGTASRASRRPRTQPSLGSCDGRARAAGQPNQPPKIARPSSAPALLRGDPPFQSVGRVHENPFLQHMEDFQVRRTLDCFRREGLVKRERVNKVDVWHDPILFDLKVLHNGAQRERSALERRSQLRKEVMEAPVGKKPAPKHADKLGVEDQHLWRALSTPMRVRKLRTLLEDDVKLHCSRLNAWDQVGLDRPQSEAIEAHNPLTLLRNMWPTSPVL